MAARAKASWLDLVPVLLTAAVLVGATLLGVELRAAGAPVAYAGPTVVEATALPVVLGRDQLGQHKGPRSAAQRHLRIDREGERWVIANAAQERRVFARARSGKGFYLHRWPLQSGDQIVLPAAVLQVTIAGSHLTLRDGDTGRRVIFDGGLQAEGEAQSSVCLSRTRRIARRVRWWLRGLSGDDEMRLFSIGGGVNCSTRWSLPGLEPESMRIHWQDGAFQAAPGVGSDALFLRAGRDATPFAARTVPVDGEDPITRLILGRTVYSLTTNDEALTLTPVANRDLWRGELPDLEMRSATWAGAGLDPKAWASAQIFWMIPGLLVAIGVLVGLRFELGARRGGAKLATLGTAIATSLALLGAWGTLLLQRGEAADALLRYALLIGSLGYATAILGLRDRLFGIGGVIWATATLLALFGTVVLLLLGSGAENTHWMRFFDKHSLLLTLFGWTVAIAAALPGPKLRWGWMRLFDSEWIVAGGGGLLVLGMAAQLTFGSEAGIGGFQPVELTKSVYVVLLGFAGMHLMEIRRRDTREYRRSPVAVLLPFLRIIGAFALVVLSIVVGVRDFSPGIILGLVTLFWLFRVGRSEEPSREGLSRWGLLRPAAVALLLCVVAAASFARLNPERLPTNMPQRDRILVWAEPELHPHSGSQVLSAMDRVGEGGWTGARAWFGPNEDVMKVPAVQDDFITAFFLNRFGGLAGLCLLGLQLVYLALLFALSRRIEAATRQADFRDQNAGRVLGFTLFGLAWMHAIHWGIAWGNTLGLLPVMGQPMTWMSAGNSHLLGFALLSLSIALITSWVLRDYEAR